MQSSEMWKELGTNLRLFEKKSFQSTAKGCVELNSTALEGTDNYTGRCYFTLLFLGSFSREGSGSVCCLAGQVSFGRSSEDSDFSIPFSIAFGKKWGHTLWGLQHSFQAMEKFDVRIQTELRT